MNATRLPKIVLDTSETNVGRRGYLGKKTSDRNCGKKTAMVRRSKLLDLQQEVEKDSDMYVLM